MDKVNEIRRENLRSLIESHGTDSVARMVNYKSASYISQMAGVHPTRRISEGTARKIELCFGLRDGWMDVRHGDEICVKSNVVALEEIDISGLHEAGRFDQCIAIAREMALEIGAVVENDKFASIVWLLYSNESNQISTLRNLGGRYLRLANTEKLNT